jgi:hypothetical protein
METKAIGNECPETGGKAPSFFWGKPLLEEGTGSSLMKSDPRLITGSLG